MIIFLVKSCYLIGSELNNAPRLFDELETLQQEIFTMTIATIEQIFLPIFLFLCYFCTFCIIRHQPKEESATQQLQPEETVSFSYKDAFSEAFDPEPEPEPVLEPEVNLKSELEIGLQQQHILAPPQPQQTLYEQTAAILDQLTKRDARKLCRPLGITQKTNSVEKTLTFMKAEIRTKFKDNPNLVIQVIQERLPGLLATPEIAQVKEGATQIPDLAFAISA